MHSDFDEHHVQCSLLFTPTSISLLNVPENTNMNFLDTSALFLLNLKSTVSNTPEAPFFLSTIFNNYSPCCFSIIFIIA